MTSRIQLRSFASSSVSFTCCCSYGRCLYYQMVKLWSSFTVCRESSSWLHSLNRLEFFIAYSLPLPEPPQLIPHHLAKHPHVTPHCLDCNTQSENLFRPSKITSAELSCTFNGWARKDFSSKTTKEVSGSHWKSCFLSWKSCLFCRTIIFLSRESSCNASSKMQQNFKTFITVSHRALLFLIIFSVTWNGLFVRANNATHSNATAPAADDDQARKNASQKYVVKIQVTLGLCHVLYWWIFVHSLRRPAWLRNMHRRSRQKGTPYIFRVSYYFQISNYWLLYTCIKWHSVDESMTTYWICF